MKNIPLVELGHRLSTTPPLRFLAACAILAGALGCAGVKPQSTTGGGGSTGSGGGGGTVIVPETCNGPCTDFDVGTIGTPAGLFGGGSGAGPCIDEPEDGTLFPNNWLRPRIHVTDGPGAYKVVFHADREGSDLTIYFDGTDHVELPKTIWQGLARHIVDEPITVSVQKSGGGTSTVSFRIAPVSATGNMVFWAANPALVGAMPSQCYSNVSLCSDASELRGFSVGDESTVQVLAINQVAQPSRKDDGNPAPVVCIGCHAGTPDDAFVSFDDHYPWRAAMASVAMGTPGAVYPSMTAGGLAALQQPGWGPFTWTKSNNSMTYWQPGLKIGVASLGLRDPTVPDPSNMPDQNDSPHLAWINLEAPNRHTAQPGDWSNWAYPSYTPGAGIDSGNSLGFLQHTGDAGGAAMPNWNHSGTTIAYVSTNASISGRLNIEATTPMPNSDPTLNGTTQMSNPARRPGLTDIFIVPFNNGLGGVASKVNGASSPDFEEYYPAFSPDDTLIAFTRVPAGQAMYANPNAEIAVVDTGGNVQRLAANDPPQCVGRRSPGVNNHWPKWSPETVEVGGKKYYWLVFSSVRAGLPAARGVDLSTHQISQLYVAPVVVTETTITSFPAIYLWNQPVDRVNTTPAWATFSIPSPG